MKTFKILPLVLCSCQILAAATSKEPTHRWNDWPAGTMLASAPKQKEPIISQTIKELEQTIAQQEKRVKLCRDELGRLIKKSQQINNGSEEGLSKEEKVQKDKIAKEYEVAKGIFETEQEKLNKLRIDLIGAKAKEALAKKNK